MADLGIVKFARGQVRPSVNSVSIMLEGDRRRQDIVEEIAGDFEDCSGLVYETLAEVIAEVRNDWSDVNNPNEVERRAMWTVVMERIEKDRLYMGMNTQGLDTFSGWCASLEAGIISLSIEDQDTNLGRSADLVDGSTVDIGEDEVSDEIYLGIIKATLVYEDKLTNDDKPEAILDVAKSLLAEKSDSDTYSMMDAIVDAFGLIDITTTTKDLDVELMILSPTPMSANSMADGDDEMARLMAINKVFDGEFGQG